jgi:hypothetical protein
MPTKFNVMCEVDQICPDRLDYIGGCGSYIRKEQTPLGLYNYHCTRPRFHGGPHHAHSSTTGICWIIWTDAPLAPKLPIYKNRVSVLREEMKRME